MPIPTEGQVKGTVRIASQQHAHVVEHIDALSVDGADGIPHLETVFAHKRAAIGETYDDRRIKGLGAGIEDQNDQKTCQKVHESAGGVDQQLFPKALIVQR